ncbi:MAG: hypothetical protein IJT51_08500 [Bacteroidales bacterium]|nr:hypothetical protein [Bacteroidales bacterium]
MFDVPILLIVYNRVDSLHDLFQMFGKLLPTELYVAANGAVADDRIDYATCLRTRNVIMPHWDCKLHSIVFDEHLSQSEMTFRAVDWFFQNVSEGIILFDETMPHPDFFPYCKQLLDRYRSDLQIVHIGGNNFQKKRRVKASYYFSAYATNWGFATWRDRWQGFSLDHVDDGQDFQTLLERYFDKKKEKKYWLRWYNILKKKNLQLFDYQYNFHLWSREGLCVTPSVNLVANVDFKKNKKRRVRRLLGNSSPIMPLQHPGEMTRDVKADRHSFKKYYKKAFFAVFAKWLSANVLLLGDE